MTRSPRAKPVTMSVPDAWMRSFIRRIASKWQATDLVEGISVEYNSRLTRSLARTSSRAKRITLHQSIGDAPRSISKEILVHELAHLIAALRSCGRAKPHGEEWARLVEDVGFNPRTRIPFSLPNGTAQTHRVFEHVCPVCHATRRAKRRVHSWRCTACVENGLSGILVIEELGGRRDEGRTPRGET